MSRNTKVAPIAEQWGKVARWAGIGNNEDGGNVRSEEAMAEETLVQGTDEKEAALEGAGGAGWSDAAGASGEGVSDPAAALRTELEQVCGEHRRL